MGFLSQHLIGVCLLSSFFLLQHPGELRANIVEENCNAEAESSADFSIMCRQQDSLVLVDFYNNSGGNNWLNSWDLSAPMDTWYGVRLNANGCVTCIDMDGNPDCFISVEQGNGLVGIITPKLGELQSLNTLILGNNSLTATIPSVLFDAPELMVLDLYGNQMIGPLPASVANAENIKVLSLGRNFLAGVIPPEIGQMTSLQDLYLESNTFIGPIPSEIGNLKNLLTLRLDNNNLSGFIPDELGDATMLRTLNVASNSLIGPLPDKIMQLTELVELTASDNKLTDTIPDAISELISLRILRVDRNSFIGPLPESIGDMANLEQLIANDNKIEGEIPESIGDLLKLLDIQLFNNQLMGEIPSSIGDLEMVRKLNLANNLLMGEIPPSIGGMLRLQDFNIENNVIGGALPEELGDLQSLRFMTAGHNQFIGPLPASLNKLENLSRLFLNDNLIDGEIPPELGEIPSLFRLSLENNDLEGCFPETLLDGCGKEYNFMNNNKLPWLGDFSIFCSGEEQLEAKCSTDTPGISGETIQEDCSCQYISCSDVSLTIDAFICHGGSFTVGNIDYTESTTVTDSLMSAEGCDSIIMYNITSLDYFVQMDHPLCGEDSNGSLILSTNYLDGLYDCTILNGDNEVVLSINDELDLPSILNELEGGAYTISVTETTMGCGFDTTIYLTPAFESVAPVYIEQALCQDVEITVNDIIYNSSNPSGTEILITENGCDSTVYIELSYLEVPEATDDIYKVQESSFSYEILENDIYHPDQNWVINVLSTENVENYSFDTDNVVYIETAEDFEGIATIDYEICSSDCENACSQAQLRVRVDKYNGYDDDVLTPNGDGHNDVFVVHGYEENETIHNSEITVINRWGETVFTDRNYQNNWRGGLHGDMSKPLPEGVYYYHLLFDTGKSVKGSRSLIR